MSGRLVTILCALGIVDGALASDWPQWLGPERNGHAPQNPPLPAALPKDLKSIWRIKVGEGHAAPIVAQGKLIYTDARETFETVHVLEAGTGKELWQKNYAQVYSDEWGAGPRSTPFVDGDRLYVQSCRGDFHCLKLGDGADVWRVSFEKDFGVKFLGSLANEGTASRRGHNGAGVIDEEAVILPVGSTEGATLVCFDKLSGRMIWKAGTDETAYSSLQVATLAGVKQVVALTADALMGVDRSSGRILWRKPLKTNAKRHAATPVIRGDTVTVNSHTFGLICFQIIRTDGEMTAKEAWVNRDCKINLATPVLVEGHFYSQGPTGFYVCVDADTGKQRWEQGGFPKNYSSTLAVGDRLLVLTEDGQLILLAANPDKYEERGRIQVCGKTWSFPAYADGKLFVRDQRELTCWELAEAKP